VRDDAQDPDTARAAVEELVAAGVVAILGHATSAMAEVTLPIVDRERVLMISPTVSADAFEGKDDWFVMLHPSARRAAAVLAEHAHARASLRRAAVVYDVANRTFSESWLNGFREAFEGRGGRVVAAVPFSSGHVPSYGQLAAAALAERPDAILLVAGALDTAAVAQQIRKRSGDVRILGTDWGFTHDVLTHGGSAVEGALFTQKVNVDDRSPRYARFVEAYTSRFNRPVDFAAILSYEAAALLATALRRDTTREGVRRAVLEVGAFEGVQGEVRIDANGDAQREHFVATVRGGVLALAP
jgi:branched-chain amino acid transport system substrate-binding protein